MRSRTRSSSSWSRPVSERADPPLDGGPMRTVFLGSPPFATPVLERLPMRAIIPVVVVMAAEVVLAVILWVDSLTVLLPSPRLWVAAVVV